MDFREGAYRPRADGDDRYNKIIKKLAKFGSDANLNNALHFQTSRDGSYNFIDPD